MILCDPYAINFLATSAMKILHHLINNESLPRVRFYLFVNNLDIFLDILKCSLITVFRRITLF